MISPQFDAVLFDCDGVLVDSEPITNGVLRDMLEDLGWKLTPQECMRLFIGKALKDEAAIIEANTGRPLGEEWLAKFRETRNTALMERVTPIRHAVAAVERIQAMFDGRVAVCSGADLHKVRLQLRKCRLEAFFGSHVYSGHDLPRSKPFPDVYLAAASALGVDPRRCAVVEDTVTGVTAGVSAGATVFGYSPSEAGHDAPAALRGAGAVHIFTDMAHLPGLLQQPG